MAKLYVVRHADAGVRGHNDGPDRDRELSDRGRRQAEGLRAQLAGTGAARLVSSPFRRCVDTLLPLGTALGLEVEADDRISEGTGFVGALELAEELRQGTAVICSHGDVIPDLLEALLRRGIKLEDEPRWPKASTWVLTRVGDGFSTGCYLPPPA